MHRHRNDLPNKSGKAKDISHSRLLIRYGIVAIAGAFLALLVWKILQLPFRHWVAVSGGIVVLCVAMILIRRLEDFLIYALVFNAPFDRFGKWFFAHPDDIVVARGISIGLGEMLLLLAFSLWFVQIFIVRKEPLPRLHKIDFFIVLLLMAQVVSVLVAPKRVLSFLDIVYNLKHVALYFFLAHKVQRRHLKWIVALILFAVILESSIAIFERTTGMVGIGHSKGNVQEIATWKQFVVPGAEHIIRAEGTTADSHALGLYFVMLLPIPLVLSVMRFLKGPTKFVMSLVMIYGLIGLIVTFTRSGWLSFAISSGLALAIILFYWKQGRAILICLAVLLGASLLYPKGYINIYDRFANAPWEIMEERFAMNKTALSVWSNHPLFGCGTANYMQCIESPDVVLYDPGEYPVHFMLLLIGAEIGLFGAVGYFGFILLALYLCFTMLSCEDLLIRGLALAFIAAFFGYLLDGLTSPLGRNIVPYYQLWLYVGLTISFQRMIKQSGKEAVSSNQPTNLVTEYR